MKKNVGFFGGTFDPIHFGHIFLALQLQEIHRLDEVLFCPAHCSPLKQGQMPEASGAHRLAMVSLAIKRIPQFSVTEYEVKNPLPSYTIDTLRFLLRERRTETSFRLLLSEEAAIDLAAWKEAQELLRIAPPLIGGRFRQRVHMPKEPHLQVTETKIFEISSTEVRIRLQQGLYCGHCVPQEVLKYIEQHHLYTHST